MAGGNSPTFVRISLHFSQRGISQTYKLGDFIRRRYVDTGFLSKTIRMDEVLVLSSEASRSICSSLSVLAALFVPKETSEKWDASLSWQPFPVRQSFLAPGVDPVCLLSSR